MKPVLDLVHGIVLYHDLESSGSSNIANQALAVKVPRDSGGGALFWDGTYNSKSLAGFPAAVLCSNQKIQLDSTAGIPACYQGMTLLIDLSGEPLTGLAAVRFKNSAGEYSDYVAVEVAGGIGVAIPDLPELPPHAEYTDSSSTSATIANLYGGDRYLFTQPLTALTVAAVENSPVESEIRFVAASSGCTIDLPAEVATGNLNVEAGRGFIINIADRLAVGMAFTPGAE